MKRKKNNQPPGIPLAFFRWYCHPDLLEEIEGDLFAHYSANKQHWQYYWLD
jgi:putative ABC transport system permease protein